MSEKLAGHSGPSALEAIKWLIVVALVVAAVWGNGFYAEYSPLYRALGVLAVALVAAAIALQTEQGKSFNQLRKDALVEMRKVVWPTRQEALQTTMIVLIFVVVVALLLFVLDWMLNGLASWVIG